MSVTLCCVSIDHDGADYLYEQVAGDLRRRCHEEWGPNRRIPAILDLAVEYGVASMTIRKAIKMLAAEGLLVTRPGRGTYVCP